MIIASRAANLHYSDTLASIIGLYFESSDTIVIRLLVDYSRTDEIEIRLSEYNGRLDNRENLLFDFPLRFLFNNSNTVLL